MKTRVKNHVKQDTKNKHYTKIEKTIMNSLYNRMNQLDVEYKSIVNEIALCNSLVNEIKLACEQHDYYVDDNENNINQLVDDLHKGIID